MAKNSAKIDQEPTVADLIQDVEVAEIIKKYPYTEEGIKKGTKFLIENKEDFKNLGTTVEGLRKASRAHRDRTINIFISYKLKEQPAADVLAKYLNLYGGNSVELGYAPNFKKGFEWTEAIRSKVRSAHWFILILPDPSLDWDWVLFETGMFRALMAPGDRLICLHHADVKPPRQIQEFNAVKANDSEILDLLKDLLVRPDAIPGMEAINPKAEESLEDVAKEIQLAIRGPDIKEHTERVRFTPYARIQLELPTNPDDRTELSIEDISKLLDKAKIVDDRSGNKGTNDLAREIFGWNRQPSSWGGLAADTLKASPDSRWHEEICVELLKAASGKAMGTIQATFTAMDGTEAVYRPLLYAMEQYPSGAIDAFLITFVKDFGASKVGDAANQQLAGYPSKAYTTLVAYMRLSYRFRWEVVEEFRDIDSLKRVPALKEAYERVMQETSSRGVGTLEDLAPIFKNIGEQNHVQELYAIFAKARKDLEMILEQTPAELKYIRKILSDFAPANQDYLTLSSSLFTQMNEELRRKDLEPAG